MNVAAGARVEEKLNCLKQLARLDIDPARLFLLLQFIDTYLKLTKAQESQYQLELAASPEREEIMEIVTSWKREGLREGRREGRKEGRKEGRREEAIRLVGFILQSKFGEIDESTQAQVEELSVSQLERMVKKLVHWSTVDELENFLRDLR